MRVAGASRRTAIGAFLNVTVAQPRRDGYLTVFECGTKQPSTSSLNYKADDLISNTVFAGLTQGQACLVSRVDTDVIVDVQGFTTRSSELSVAAPTRLLDTRKSNPRSQGRSVAADSAVEVVVDTRAGVPATASAVALVITAAQPRDDGYLVSYPCDGARPATASLNFMANRDTAGTVLVELSTDRRVCIYSTATTDIIVDLLAHVPADSALTAIDPATSRHTTFGQHRRRALRGYRFAGGRLDDGRRRRREGQHPC